MLVCDPINNIPSTIVRLNFYVVHLTCTYNCTYYWRVLEWDKDKAGQNKNKHGIAFADVFGVLEDPRALTVDEVVRGEVRYVTMGLDGFGCRLHMAR